MYGQSDFLTHDLDIFYWASFSKLRNFTIFKTKNMMFFLELLNSFHYSLKCHNAWHIQLKLGFQVGAKTTYLESLQSTTTTMGNYVPVMGTL